MLHCTVMGEKNPTNYTENHKNVTGMNHLVITST